MTNGKTNGHQLQEQLFRWYTTLTQGNFGHEPKLGQGLHALKHHVEVLIRDGWTLTMTADDSPADRVGIDFIWSNPNRGWFPLDAKAAGQTRCRLIQQVHVGNNSEAGECGQLRSEDRTAFLEQLVALARTSQPIDFAVCVPPSIRVAQNGNVMLDSLRFFQRSLEKATTQTTDDRFAEWALALKPAIGYSLKQNRGGASDAAVETARKAIAAAIDAFFASFFKENSQFALECSRMQTSLKRSDRLQYVIGEDKIKAVAGQSNELVVLGGLAGLIRKRYEARYRELLAQHSCAEWLLQRKRTFETKGVECVIHSILDAFQRQTGGRRAA